MIFSLAIAVVLFFGLIFLTIAPTSRDPTRGYLIGGSILAFGLIGMGGFYAYSYAYQYTRFPCLGMLLAEGWGEPTGETWVLEKSGPIQEITRDDPEADKDIEAGGTGPKIKKMKNSKLLENVKAMIPDDVSKDIKSKGGEFHYYILPHTGDRDGRDIVATPRTLRGTFEYHTTEVMIKDFPRKVPLALGTGDKIGMHSIYIGNEPLSFTRKIELALKRESQLTHEVVNVYLITDSNFHRWLARKKMGLEVPSKDAVKSAMNLVKTIDGREYLEKIEMLENKIETLDEQLHEKWTFEAMYSPKVIYSGEEKTTEEIWGIRSKPSFWNWKNTLLLITGLLMIGITLYMIAFQGAFQISPAIQNTTQVYVPPIIEGSP